MKIRAFLQKTSLYYHPTSRSYYRYDEKLKKYLVFGPQNNVKWAEKRFKRRADQLFGSAYLQQLDQQAVDALETVLDLVERVSFLAGDDSEEPVRTFFQLDEDIQIEVGGFC